jgi:hypothetical protein
MTLKPILIIFLSLTTVTVFGYWRYSVAVQPHGVAQFAFIQDPSDSIQSDCGRVVGFAERALAMPDTKEGSTITLFALGNPATANEAQLLGEFRVPVVRRVIEGQRAAARDRQALLSGVRNRCAGVQQTRVSPVFQALKRGVEHLHGVGAPDDSRHLFIQTDGEETENAQIRKALNGQRGAMRNLPPPIQNAGVRVTFCGLAETVGMTLGSDNKVRQKSRQRDPARADRLREVWGKLFTNPELVAFEPYCARETAAGESPGE